MRISILIPVILYGIACCLPALEFRYTQKPNDILWGAGALAVGWSGIFAGVFAWYANPLWLAGLLFTFLRKPAPAVVAGLAAVLLAASTFTLLGRELPADEGGVGRMTVVRFLPGCYVWLVSVATLPVTAWLRRAR